MKKINAFIKRIDTRLVSLVVAVSLTVLSIPAAVLAWGPARTTFTQENPADYVTFNSITNNPTYGDERNFFRVRDVSTNEAFDDEANLVPGKEYEALIFYHNNAKTSLNASGVGVAQNAFARAEMPALVKAGSQNTEGQAFVGASNANPQSVYDYITFKNSTAGDIAPRYVPGTAKIYSNGAVNGQALSNSLFDNTGIKLGYDSLNGTLPGCDQYSGIIKWRFVADQANFTFAKDVRVAGTKGWQDQTNANPGQKLEYRLTYTNTGTTVQNNVILKDVLPAGITYIPGETMLYDGANPAGRKLGDGIGANGVNIGSYAPGANAILVFSATVAGKECTTLINTAAAQTNNGNVQDTAKVIIPGNNCAVTTLPTTGPVEVIAGLVGVAAITVGVVYYIKSRRDLETALHNAQANPTTSSKSNEPGLPEIDEQIKK